MSPFEIVMLISFGAAWPFSLYRSYKSKSTGGKSEIFLWIVLIGYISGIFHKLFFALDAVIFLYFLNASMVLADIILFHRNKRLEKKLPS